MMESNKSVFPEVREVMKHQLPQIPSSMSTNPRMAVSKASAKAKDNVTPTKHEATSPVSTTDTSAIEQQLMTTPVKRDSVETKPPSNLPTPPSDGTPTENTPTKDKHQSTGRDDDSTEKNHDNVTVSEPKNEEELDVSPLKPLSFTEPEVQEKNNARNGIKVSTSRKKDNVSKVTRSRRAKTKGHIKQMMSDKNKLEDVTSSCSNENPESLAVSSPVHSVGDMFWGRVPGHAWWPCMVALDPNNGTFFKSQATTKKTPRSVYHVQFFGQEGERAWVFETRLTPFTDVHTHLQWLDQMRAKAICKKDKSFNQVNHRRRIAWEVACDIAKEAFKLDTAERNKQYTISFPLASPSSKKLGKEQSKKSPTGGKVEDKNSSRRQRSKRKLSSGTSQELLDSSSRKQQSPPRKRQRRSKSGAGVDRVEKLSTQELTQFMVYCSKKRDFVRREHPTYSQQQIEKVLKEQWDELPGEQKQKFIPMGSDVKNLSQMLDESKRTPKPSKKKLELEASGEIVKKRKRSSSAAWSERRRSAPVKSSKGDSMSGTIDQVAQGAGTIPTFEDSDDASVLVIDEGPGSGGKPRAGRKKLSKDSDTDDTSSVASSRLGLSKSLPPLQGVILENGDIFAPEIYSLQSSGVVKKERVCQLCEEAGELIQCEGGCYGVFHPTCLQLKKSPEGILKCDQCLTGRHTCFVCKKPSSSTCSVERCSVNGCGKYYHAPCIQAFHLTTIEEEAGRKLICPLHTCATCAADDCKSTKATKGKLFRCVRCPTAYHVGDFCIAAGCTLLGGYNIVCTRHFTPVKTQSHHSHVNVSWCFSCSQGGSLICCESCPASFHVECLKLDAPVEGEGAWYCPDCQAGRRPLYGDIVWVKIGSYRWWPGEICHPRNVPTNIQEKSHQVGEFPVMFFGSRDYFWMSQARVFLFQEGDKGCKENAGNAKGLSKSFQKALKEGALAYKMWKEFKDRLEVQEQARSDRKPAPYKHIKTNQAVGAVTIYKADPSELARCECKITMEHPCGYYSDCINRMTLEECHPAVCPAGDRCENQRFQKREYPDAIPFKADGRGWGLRSLCHINKGDFVNEYVGELIDDTEAKRRFKQYDLDNVTNYYMLTLDTKRIIDAGPKGNLSRFMNHSCAPNCYTQKWTVNGDVRVGLFAKHDIPAGTELTFNYNLDALGNEKKICACGAATCSGFLGVKAKKKEPLEKTGVKIKKKKKKNLQKKVAEDECYRCGDGGELIVCDRGSCTKVYHLKCLKLNKMPHGKWLCPWHHCDECGKPAMKLCSECPNSFCPMHIQGNIFQLPDAKLICSDHQDILTAVEASKLENEPNAKAPSLTTTSSEATSTAGSDICSSPCHQSDSDTSLAEDEKHQPLTVIKKLKKKKQQSKKSGKSRDKDDTAASTDTEAISKATKTTSPVKRRGRKKKVSSPAPSAEEILESAARVLIKSPKILIRKDRTTAKTVSSIVTSTTDTEVSPAAEKAELSKVSSDSDTADRTKRGSSVTKSKVSSDSDTADRTKRSSSVTKRRQSVRGGGKATAKPSDHTEDQNGAVVKKAENPLVLRSATPMFEDTDSDDCQLVIDIP